MFVRLGGRPGIRDTIPKIGVTSPPLFSCFFLLFISLVTYPVLAAKGDQSEISLIMLPQIGSDESAHLLPLFVSQKPWRPSDLSVHPNPVFMLPLLLGAE